MKRISSRAFGIAMGGAATKKKKKANGGGSKRAFTKKIHAAASADAADDPDSGMDKMRKTLAGARACVGDAFSRPAAAAFGAGTGARVLKSGTNMAVDLPAIVDPPICECWSKPETAMWSSPGSWSTEIFAGISTTAAINGAKACMCCQFQRDMPAGEHRKMHISLNNGEIRIDLPILETVPGQDTPMYTKHIYCTKCRKFERKFLFHDKPTTPIAWSCCSL